MKITLTGATGYIGRSLGAYLSNAGHEVDAIGRGRSLKDMTAQLEHVQPDVVIHLASLFIAEHQSSQVDDLIESNVAFGARLLEAMKCAGLRRLINTGTSWQHYENARDNPVCLYAATKTAFEAVLRYYAEAEGFQVVTLKIFDTYGPDDTRPKLIPKLIAAFDAGVKPELSEGRQRLDLLHISDLLAAFTATAEQLAADKTADGYLRDFALSSGERHSLRQIVELLEAFNGRSLGVVWGARPYRRREVMEPWTEGATPPYWQPKIKFADGLARLIAKAD